MQVSFPDDQSLRLDFLSIEETERFMGAAQQQSGFLLQVDHAWTLLPHRLAIRLAAPSFSFTFDAEAVQELPGGTVFQLVDWDLEKAVELGRRLRGELVDGEAADGEADEEGRSSLETMSPAMRIRQLDGNEKMRMASRASFVERQVLLRDGSPQILQALINNPRIETKEVLEIARSPYANGGILEQIAKKRKWMSHPEMPALIARNPKTPPPMALRLLDSLSTPELQQMGKSSAIRETLRKAALRLYLKRTGQLKGLR